MQIIYGSRVNPFTGNAESEKGRLTIYQPIIPELDKDVHLPGNRLYCQLFGPSEELAFIEREMGLMQDPDIMVHCLRFEGDTGEFVRELQRRFPQVEFANADNDEIFEDWITDDPANNLYLFEPEDM